MNEIASMKTSALTDPKGRPVSAVMVGVNIDDPQRLDAFAVELTEKMLMQRMVSPPDTSILIVTAIGDFELRRFAPALRRALRASAPMTAFLSIMTRADLVHGTRDGQILGAVSLLPPKAPAPPPKPWWKFWQSLRTSRADARSAASRRPFAARCRGGAMSASRPS